MRYLLVCFAGLATGCIIENGGGGGGGGVCPADATYEIDTGASIDHQAGVDAGYYVTYAAGGHWHIEWTCDTHLSAEGCEFSGQVTLPTPAGGANASCYQCEPDDNFSSSDKSGTTTISFDTLTSTGIDGIDFDATPGTAIELDAFINGLDQSDLVWLPSQGHTATPECMPIRMLPG